MHLLALLTIFRIFVLPVQFQDRELSTTSEQQLVLMRQAQEYFNRQYTGTGQTFRFELAPTVTLRHSVSWYGGNYPDRKDTHLADAVREACQAVRSQVDFSGCDTDGDGMVDGVCLLFAGPGEHTSGVETDIYPQLGWLSADGGVTVQADGLTIDRFSVAPEGELGVLCHEFAHILGLPDFYDTDGAESGGNCPGLWGLSLMDDGCRGTGVPDFGAPECELLGLGTAEPLKVGSYTLTPIAAGRRYLKAETDREGEYFLFEARNGGLYIYHIDRSDNPAGYSARQQKELTARERWETGEINNNPAHPCVRLIPADPAATGAAGVPFPGGGASSFGSDTPSAFRSWSGAASGLALTGIRPAADGAVTFEVVRPITIGEVAVYQDAALIRWTPSPSLEGIQGYEISWNGGKESGLVELPADAVSFTIEGLQPRTEYAYSVQLRCSATERYSAGGRFETRILRKGTYPYIYLADARRNLDGSFPAGSQIPLRVFNTSDVLEVQWTMDGAPIQPDANGTYTLLRSGVLRAKILYLDGTSETLMKEITVQ